VNRRELLGALIGTAALSGASVAATSPTVEIEPCPMDLCETSLRHAVQQSGRREHFTYILTVHPRSKAWAIRSCLGFPEAHFQLVTDDTLRYVDEWSLRGPDRTVHSSGA
jgi:hypothetical protein